MEITLQQFLDCKATPFIDVVHGVHPELSKSKIRDLMKGNGISVGEREERIQVTDYKAVITIDIPEHTVIIQNVKSKENGASDFELITVDRDFLLYIGKKNITRVKLSALVG